ncbi:MAG: PadR family transcriptional regulator [Rubrobacteraceae bacterium]
MYVEVLILSNLLGGSSYGYEIKKNVERVMGGAFAINNNVLYPALRKFEQMGAVEKEVERQEGKPNRHVYRATELGREIFGEMLREFPPEKAGNDAEFLVRVAFMHLLEPEERLRILRTRKEFLEGVLGHLSAVRPDAEESGYPHAAKVLGFWRGQREREIEWIEELAKEAGARP